MSATVDELQKELLAICRGGYVYETWAGITGVSMNERRDFSGRERGQRRVNEIRREIYALNPHAALYFGWGPSEPSDAKGTFYATCAAALAPTPPTPREKL